VSVVLASLVLAAIFACPCPAMKAERHGCCADESPSIRPADCCRVAASPAQWTPRVAPAAPVLSFAPVAFSLPAIPSAPLPTMSSVSFPLPPPRVLRI
jgi:hypothetical protein